MWPEGKTAIVVIHGVGQQSPFDTLDGFVRGLWRAFEAAMPDSRFEARHTLLKHDNWAETCIELIRDGDVRSPIHCYEYYWAHQTERRISMGEVFDWLVKTGAAAQRYYDRNAELVKRYELQRDESFGPHYFLSSGRRPTRKTRFRKYWYLKHAGTALRAAQLLMNLLGPLVERFPVLGKPLRAVLTVVGSISRPFIVGYIGDIAIYTTTDVKSRHYEVRQRILDGAVKKLEWILQSENPEYRRILVVGHSLGSVVAYDALNRINNAMNIGRISPVLRKRLHGLVTFGSPLDKVAFFFRERVPREQYVKHQLLAHYHGFKARDLDPEWRPPRNLGNGIARYLDHMRWVNFWDARDPISGPLDFYDIPPEDNRELGMGEKWGVAHVKYWEQPKMYQGIIADFWTSTPS